MPKVLRIINRFNLGGPTYNAAYLTKYLSPEFETLLVGGAIDKSEGNSEYIVRQLNLEPVIIKEMRRSLNPVMDLRAYKKIKRLISEFKPDIVHTHASKAGALGRMAAYNLKVPVIIHTFHGHVFDAYFSGPTTFLYKSIERFLAKKSSCIIALSENQKTDLADKYKICPADKIEVIPLGFDLTRFQENTVEKRKKFRIKYQLNDDEIAIAIIGRLVPIKNHSLFLNSLKYVVDRTTKHIKVFIVGDGECSQDIESQIKSLGLTYTYDNKESAKNLITMTSWITTIDEVISGVDIIALTSLNEGTPVSLVEAQAANKPIITTNVGGIKNVVIPGVTAILSANNDLKAFSENLLNMLESDELRFKLSQKGWEHVKNKYHYSRLIIDTSNLYNKMLNSIPY